MAHEKNHDYHILAPSTWPLLSALGGCAMLVGIIFWMHDITPFVFFGGLAAVLYCMFGWWSEVVAESKIGDHTSVVR
ncbi:MAG: cytochrome c oxidase subunit 3, partial [Sulfitobacter sp.]|nr:cytochrome c oxidase subunit 3 [Sulfitobacter sp.]